MIEYRTGDLLSSGAEALVNAVNCVGVMGNGIALQFKHRYPANFRAYAEACKRGEIGTGRMLTTMTLEMPTRWIINFPTKQHWRNPSRIEYVQKGLPALVWEIRQCKAKSVAIPPLGCGNGGLDWHQVKPLIEQAVSQLQGVHVLLYEPALQPAR